MILINVLTILGCVYILWRAQQVNERNRRALRAVKETKYLRRRKR